MFEKIKNWFWKRKLEQDVKSVNRQLLNTRLEDAKSIGLLACIPDEKKLQQAEQYLHKLQKANKEVNLLAFIPQKEVPHYCMPKLSVDYIPRKMVNWFGIPQGKPIKDFQQKKFDILIDLCLERQKVVLYVVATSSANMRVGLYRDDMVKHYDFMISGSEQKESMDNYIIEVEKYLNQINTKNHE
ncbi:MAG: hypothetical protein K9H84_06015 [Bacteroidales bacterium]|nr:hypothetical protein [Bacteroidales bacterium]